MASKTAPPSKRDCNVAKKDGERHRASLIRPLFEGPVDIVGDIHGESGPLFTLMDRLGYDSFGRHPKKRRLVFVGDLVDRGPDSIAVVEFVRSIVEAGNAQMVLGNHELNLLLEKKKHGNHWFYGETEVIRKDLEALSFQRVCTDDVFRKSTMEWLNRQPLILERDGLRVVHAAYNAESIVRIRAYEAAVAAESIECSSGSSSSSGIARRCGKGVVGAYRYFNEQTTAKVAGLKKEAGGADAGALDIAWGLIEQNENPVKVLSSGLERRAAAKFFAGGKWRQVERSPWWETYDEKSLVVVGHYWRRFAPPDRKLVGDFAPAGVNPFEDAGQWGVAGGGGGVMCVDYSVGLRYEERGKTWPVGSLGTGLCALRHPEKILMFDGGRVQKMTSG